MSKEELERLETKAATGLPLTPGEGLRLVAEVKRRGEACRAALEMVGPVADQVICPKDNTWRRLANHLKAVVDTAA